MTSKKVLVIYHTNSDDEVAIVPVPVDELAEFTRTISGFAIIDGRVLKSFDDDFNPVSINAIKGLDLHG